MSKDPYHTEFASCHVHHFLFSNFFSTSERGEVRRLVKNYTNFFNPLLLQFNQVIHIPNSIFSVPQCYKLQLQLRELSLAGKPHSTRTAKVVLEAQGVICSAPCVLRQYIVLRSSSFCCLRF